MPHHHDIDDDRILISSGLTLAEWREMPWWPNGTDARVAAGYTGHDQEITVNFEAYSFGECIPGPVGDVLSAALPEHWSVDNRDTRIEVHPSGRFAGGYTAEDIEVVNRALTTLGFNL